MNLQDVIRDLNDCFPNCYITITVLKPKGKKELIQCHPKRTKQGKLFDGSDR